ncbi:MAG: hypothetical protein IJK84_03670 [Bacteroidales bacterium]|nr:hypothetical protein [Bacteroidales bacterium]
MQTRLSVKLFWFGHPSALDAPISPRSFFFRKTSLLPQFFVAKRKNEGRTEEELRGKERRNRQVGRDGLLPVARSSCIRLLASRYSVAVLQFYIRVLF